jgi:hypothetical protein
MTVGNLVRTWGPEVEAGALDEDPVATCNTEPIDALALSAR